MGQTRIDNKDIKKPLTEENITLASGISILPNVSGQSNVGSAALKFGTVYADNFVGNLSGSFVRTSGDTMTGNLTLSSGANIYSAVSGIGNIGQPTVPVNNVFANALTATTLTLAGVSIDDRFVNITGDTITGDLTLANTVNILTATSGGSNIGSATKPFGNVYAQNLVGPSGGYLNIAGGQMDGALNFATSVGITFDGSGNSNIGESGYPVGTLYVDNIISTNVSGSFVHISGDTMTGNLNFSGGVITQLAATQFKITNNASPSGIYLDSQGANLKVGNESPVGGGSAVKIFAGSAGVEVGNISGTVVARMYGPSTTSRIDFNDTILGGTYIGADPGGLKLSMASVEIHMSGSNISTSGNIIPKTSGVDNLGSSGNHWGTIYVNNIVSTGLSGAYVLKTGDTMTGSLTMASGLEVIMDPVKVGSSNTATGGNSSAIGFNNTANGEQSVTVGFGNTASGDSSLTFGRVNTATGSDSQAFGRSNTASAQGSSAFGYLNAVSGVNSLAIGYNNNGKGDGSSAVGNSNITREDLSSAFGYNNTASGTSASAVGDSNIANAQNSSAVGHTNIASAQNSSAVGNTNTANGDYSSAIGYNNAATGTQSSAVGYDNDAYGENSSAFGFFNSAQGEDSSAIGNNNTTAGLKASAVGNTNIAAAENSSAFGYNNTANGTGTQVFGKDVAGALNETLYLGAPSGVMIQTGKGLMPETSGTQSLGSTDLRWGTLWVTAISGVTLGTNFSGGAITSNLTPTSSGTLSLGTAALPFSGVVSNNYSTTFVSGTVSSATTTIDWSAGSSQMLAFVTGQPSGTSVLFSGMTAGSSYALQTVSNASGTAAITWPSSVKWQQGISGSMTLTDSAKDLFTFFSVDGTTSFGNYSNDYR